LFLLPATTPGSKNNYITQTMAFSLRKLSKRFMLLTNSVLIIVFLIACFQPRLSPETFWGLGYLSVGFPYLLLLMLAFGFFWLFAKPRFILLTLIALAIGYPQIALLYNLNNEAFILQKKEGELRVMTWNVKGFYGSKPGRKAKLANADSIFSIILKYQPDVVCLQEYGQYDDKNLGKSPLDVMRKMGYNFEVLSKDYSRKTYSYSSGVAIFSKLPLLATERIPYTSSAESLLFADVLFQKDTLRIFTTHLQSYRFSEIELDQIEKVRQKETPSIAPSRSLLSKMKSGFLNRASQVDIMAPQLDKSPHPEIVCLDMNDVPNSYAYHHVRGNRVDVFLQKGFGIGRTYLSYVPTLRIDFIFADPRFETSQISIPQLMYSDHLPIIADLKWQP
jgi:endonuclease/exonuclease/phosphatase family metal-dependent hydrolase